MAERAESGFEIFEHTADVGFEAWAQTPEALFETCGRALLEVATEPGRVEAREALPIEVAAAGYDELLVDWLNEILYLFDSGRFAPSGFEVRELTREKLTGVLTGEPRDPARHPWQLIVKAVTYHDLFVGRRNGRWEARVVLDV